jgi:hypothetical protein
VPRGPAPRPLLSVYGDTHGKSCSDAFSLALFLVKAVLRPIETKIFGLSPIIPSSLDHPFLFTMRCWFETQGNSSSTIDTNTSLRTAVPASRSHSHSRPPPRNTTISSPRTRRAHLVSVLQEALDIIADMDECIASDDGVPLSQ